MKYSKDLLEVTVKNATNYAVVCRVLGVKENTGSHSRLIKQIKDLGLDTSHFTGSGWSKGKELGHKRTIEEYLRKDNPHNISSYKLKQRLLEEGLFKRKCYNVGCGITSWLGQDVPLELEHIDGDKRNNELDNLTLLCPNCHAFTLTYRGKNKKLRRLQKMA